MGWCLALETFRGTQPRIPAKPAPRGALRSLAWPLAWLPTPKTFATFPGAGSGEGDASPFTGENDEDVKGPNGFSNSHCFRGGNRMQNHTGTLEPVFRGSHLCHSAPQGRHPGDRAGVSLPAPSVCAAATARACVYFQVSCTPEAMI